MMICVICLICLAVITIVPLILSVWRCHLLFALPLNLLTRYCLIVLMSAWLILVFPIVCLIVFIRNVMISILVITFIVGKLMSAFYALILLRSVILYPHWGPYTT